MQKSLETNTDKKINTAIDFCFCTAVPISSFPSFKVFCLCYASILIQNDETESKMILSHRMYANPQKNENVKNETN